MKLQCVKYTSPIDTEGVFENVFIEDTRYEMKRKDNHFSITFEMYYFKDDKRIILDTANLAFLGMNSDSINSNKTTIISIPNPNYESLVAAIPTTINLINRDYKPQYIEEPNPDYNPEDSTSPAVIEVSNPEYNADIPQTIVVPNPDYRTLISQIPAKVNIPMLQYLMEHEGNMPDDFEMVDWGYPTFEDVMPNFDGGILTNPKLTLNNGFARGWFLNNLIIKGEKIGKQFQFIE